MVMVMDKGMNKGMDGIIRLTEGRGVRRAALQDHLYIHRYLRGLQGYLRNHLCRLVPEGVGTSEKGREIIGIGTGTGRESEGGNESEGDMEGQPREAGMEMEETGAAVVGSAGVCRIHRMRASPFF